MEIPTATLGGLRLALQVTSQHRRPLLAIYFQFHNRFTPNSIVKGRTQEVYVQFWLTNIGGLAAEAVCLELESDFKLGMGAKMLSSLSVFQGMAFKRFEPAQSFPLFHIKGHVLWRLGDRNSEVAGGKHFDITMNYDGPHAGFNRPVLLLSRLRRRKQYSSSFHFNPSLFADYQFPPGEYV